MSHPKPPSTALTIDRALQWARQQGVDRLDAQVLLSTLLTRPRSWLLAHGDEALSVSEQTRFGTSLQRRAEGEPLAYILGHKEFFGLTLAVSPEVLVPRPDTEALVEWALALIPPNTASKVLDLGTGSGAIALAIQQQRPQAQVTATDASLAALRVAQANAQQHQLPVRFLHGHWLAPLAGQCFDLIVSNPPYIAEGDPHLAALHHEPRAALTAGANGLADLAHLILEARGHLQPGAWLVLEHGYDQADAVAQQMTQAGYSNVSKRTDLGGQVRCTGGQMLSLVLLTNTHNSAPQNKG